MGFGIALIGYAFLLFNIAGGAVIGAPLLAYGFFLASRLEKYFLNASISALFMLPHGIVQLSALLFGFEPSVTLDMVVRILYVGAWLVMSFFWLLAVAKIARENRADKLELQARNRLVFTIVFVSIAFFAEILAIGGAFGNYGGMVVSVKYVIEYAAIFVNLFFLHTCFVLITSERQYEKDKQQLAQERAKEMEKRHKQQKEAADRIAKRKK